MYFEYYVQICLWVNLVYYQYLFLPIFTYFSEYNGSVKSSSFSSKISSLPETINYDTDTLRRELTARGYNPGPITVTTKRVYLKKLHQLKKYPALVNKENRSISKRGKFKWTVNFKCCEFSILKQGFPKRSIELWERSL